MRKAIKKEFGTFIPRAVVLDDDPGARAMTARLLRRRGYEALTFSNPRDFYKNWHPGMADVIISDWDLSARPADKGDHVLAKVRKRDWDVPFVLISGKLEETKRKVGVLEDLLENGSARFVERGPTGDGVSGIEAACDAAEELIERRDLALLKLILPLREGAGRGMAISTSKGLLPAANLLERLVSSPKASHEAGRPIASARRKRALPEA